MKKRRPYRAPGMRKIHASNGSGSPGEAGPAARRVFLVIIGVTILVLLLIYWLFQQVAG